MFSRVWAGLPSSVAGVEEVSVDSAGLDTGTVLSFDEDTGAAVEEDEDSLGVSCAGHVHENGRRWTEARIGVAAVRNATGFACSRLTLRRWQSWLPSRGRASCRKDMMLGSVQME
jgi:hypothetical protein